MGPAVILPGRILGSLPVGSLGPGSKTLTPDYISKISKNKLNTREDVMIGPDPQSKLSHVDHAAAGALSGVFTRALTQPFDVLKIRFQLQVEPISRASPQSKYKGLLQSLHTVVREERLGALWKGHISAQGLTVIYMGVEFATFEMLSKTLASRLDNPSSTTSHFLGGAGAGASATVVSYPLDIIRTRFAAQGNIKIYRSHWQAVGHIYSHEGVYGFYRGLWAGLLHCVPQASLHFGCYELYKRVTRSVFRIDEKDLSSVNMASGSLAGVTSKLLVYPFDTGKRRLQIVGFESARTGFGVTNYYRGLMHYILLALKQEGISGFYKGASWALLKSGISTGLYFSIYERFCSIINYYKCSMDNQ